MAAWPPLTLTTKLAETIAICENISVSSGVTSGDVHVLHMAALLFDQDWIEARHLWRRIRDDTATASVVLPWWNVGAAAVSGNVAGVWQALQELHVVVAAWPDADRLGAYVNEIGQTYRFNLAMKLKLVGKSTLASYAPSALGFSSEAELVSYLETVGQGRGTASSASFSPVRTDLVAFLESRLKV